MSHIKKLIGRNIKLARVKKEWSQAELAYKLDVEQSYISRIESGSVAASCERIYEIIHLLESSTEDIFPPSKDVNTKFKEF